MRTRPASLETSLRMRLVLLRGGGAVLGAAAGASLLGALAWMEGSAFREAAVLGALLGALASLAHRPPWAPPVREIEARSDPDALVRAALAPGPAAAPGLASSLRRRAAGRRVRFRRNETVRGLTAAALLSVFLAAWSRSGELLKPSLPAAAAGGASGLQGAAGTGPGTGAPGSEPALAEAVRGADNGPAPGGTGPEDSGPGAGSRSWRPVPVRLQPPPAGATGAVRGPRDAGRLRAALDRYLRGD